ncbi:unannotated protein [freshwater metagenome]|uniref:Unannotated protein n=1 Tax=freshwater metagenome TaxID=449393 RepID=A0A6J7GGQ0_9ZZZZ
MVLPPTLSATVLTGAGKPRSEPAQIIPATDCKIPRIPSDAITGIASRIDGLPRIAVPDFFFSGLITRISMAAPSAAPTMSATKNAIQ